MSKFKCFNCLKFGHFASNCLEKRKIKGKQHTFVDDVDDNQPLEKKTKDSHLVKVVESIRKDFYFISSLSSSITNNNEIWLVDSGASRHITGYRSSLTDLTKKDYSIHVDLGNVSKYAVKGVGYTSFQLDLGDILHMSGILFVPGLKKNLLFIYALEDKGYIVSFVDGKGLVWHKDSSIDSTDVIGV